MLDFSDALCASSRYLTSEEYDWVPELDELDKEINARSVCNKCPIKLECAQQALSTREAWGIWGGMEEFRMRRALGVDSRGEPRIYKHDLKCPFCDGTDLTVAKKRQTNGYPVECNYCGVQWESYRIPDKIRKVLKRQHDQNISNHQSTSSSQ